MGLSYHAPVTRVVPGDLEVLSLGMTLSKSVSNIWVSYYVVPYYSRVHDELVPKPSPAYAYDPVLISLGDAIRAARKQLDMSQEALAAEAGLDRAYVSGIERGEHNVAVMNLSKIAKALDVTLKDLMGLAKI